MPPFAEHTDIFARRTRNREITVPQTSVSVTRLGSEREVPANAVSRAGRCWPVVEFLRTDPGKGTRVIACNGFAGPECAAKDGQDEMGQHLAVVVELNGIERLDRFGQIRLDTRFFPKLSFGGREERFSEFDKSAREAPKSLERVFSALDQQHTAIVVTQDADTHTRCIWIEPGHG